MKNNKAGEQRRKLLKSIAAGGGAIVAGKSLPDEWAKPVVDSVLLPSHAQTSLPVACNIAGTYCWIQTNVQTTFTVLADGTVNIDRINLNNGNTWAGSGSTSNGALGGTFAIQAARTSPPNPANVRDYTGTVVCDSTEISGTFDNPNNPAVPQAFLATQGACPPP